MALGIPHRCLVHTCVNLNRVRKGGGGTEGFPVVLSSERRCKMEIILLSVRTQLTTKCSVCVAVMH